MAQGYAAGVKQLFEGNRQSDGGVDLKTDDEDNTMMMSAVSIKTDDSDLSAHPLSTSSSPVKLMTTPTNRTVMAWFYERKWANENTHPKAALVRLKIKTDDQAAAVRMD